MSSRARAGEGTVFVVFEQGQKLVEAPLAVAEKRQALHNQLENTVEKALGPSLGPSGNGTSAGSDLLLFQRSVF